MLSGTPIGRTVGPAVMRIEGWPRLMGEYARQFGGATPGQGRPE